MIIDQANAAAELNGQFFNKKNRFAQNESANRNALVDMGKRGHETDFNAV